MVFKIAIRNILRSPRRNFLIVFLIAAGSACFFFADTLFDNTNEGLKKSFVGSLTASYALGSDSDFGISLFGNELPIVADYEPIIPLLAFREWQQKLDGLKGLEVYSPIVSAAASVKIGAFTVSAPVFGVEAESYFRVLPDIKIDYGDILALSEDGVFLNSAIAGQAEARLKRPLKAGEEIVFSMYSQGSFQLRKGHFAGVYSYPAPNEVLDRLILASPSLVRSLANYTMGFTDPDAATIEEDDFSFDSLFDFAQDTQADFQDGLDLSELEAELKDIEERNLQASTDSAAWSFILLKAEKNREKLLASGIRSIIKKEGLPARLLSWREAAGTTALMPWAVQTVFAFGLGFIMLGAVLVITNALVTSVLERSSEYATMRGIGAQKLFITRLVFTESIIITLLASFTGLLAASIGVYFVNRSGIEFVNPLLVSLFGTVLRVRPGVLLYLKHSIIAFGAGSLAWLYPVYLALRVQPARAMGKAGQQ